MMRAHAEHRVQYSGNYKTLFDAYEALQTLFACGEIDQTDQPQVEYVGGSKPYIISLVNY